MQRALEGNAWLYDGVFVLLIVFFTYFYTTLTFRADDVADNIKKQGGYIPGIRPGGGRRSTSAASCAELLLGAPSTSRSSASSPPSSPAAFGGLPFQFGGTALLIVVGVALDTVQQIEDTSSAAATRASPGRAGPRSAVDCGRPHEG